MLLKLRKGDEINILAPSSFIDKEEDFTKGLEILKKWVPLTHDAFVSNRLNALTISSEGIEYIKSLIHGKKTTSKNISKRELDTIKKIFSC